MNQKFVTSIELGFGEPVIVSTGSADAGKVVGLGQDGKLDPSVLPEQCYFPAGVVQHFAMASVPSGWLAADGSAVSRETYVNLFAAIGTTFGSGDGSTTFNLPDLRGEFIRGYDNGRGVDNGRVFGSQQLDQLQGHWHDVYQASDVGGGIVCNSAGVINTNSDLSVHTAVAKGIITNGTNGNPRVGAETRPRNVALLACIKY